MFDNHVRRRVGNRDPQVPFPETEEVVVESAPSRANQLQLASGLALGLDAPMYPTRLNASSWYTYILRVSIAVLLKCVILNMHRRPDSTERDTTAAD